MRSDVQSEGRGQEMEVLKGAEHTGKSSCYEHRSVSLGTRMKSRGQGGGPTHIRTMSHRGRSTELHLFLQQLLQSRSREGDANVSIPPGLGFCQTAATEGDEVKTSRTLPRM